MKSYSILILLSYFGVITAGAGDALSPQIYAQAYPETVTKAKSNMITLFNGIELRFNDGKNKTFQEKLKNADLEDQLSQVYPIGKGSFRPPVKNDDPGRFRCDAFFRAVYGKTKQEVRKNLVSIIWLPKSAKKKIWITQINGVDKQLIKVSSEIDKLSPSLKQFAMKLGGTFNWRTISGTSRLSAHSFGIAIDLNPDKSSYWKWDRSYRYKNQFPKQIIEIFEKHGFIWGGKWYHYDTMHFEYRPELLRRNK